jgi:ribosomal protein S18 acetylase RimI-like enzyme
MHIRTAELSDVHKIKTLYLRVSESGDGISRKPHEVTDEYITNFVTKSLESGLIIVADHPTDSEQIIGEIHGYTPGIEVFKHILSDLTIAVDPEFQGQKIGRTLFTIFLEEIGLNRPDVGRVELVTRESNHRAIKLYQSLGFQIEGRMEMRIKTKENLYEADIPMGWQNPNFEFES